MSLLLGIDLGTSYFKVGLFRRDGTLQGLGRVRVPAESPKPGWNELPVEKFREALQLALREAFSQAGAGAGEVAGISYSSQANTFMLVDAGDVALTPFVIWNDRRAAPLDPAIAAFGGRPEFRARTGFKGLAPEFMAVKARWYRETDAALWKRVARVVSLPEYLCWLLTGRRIADSGTGAFTGLIDVEQGAWERSHLEFFGLGELRSAEVALTGTVAGKTSAAAEKLGLRAGVPVAVGSIDHHVAAIGAGVGGISATSISLGTVSAALCLVDRIEDCAGCFHGRHADGKRFFRLAFDAFGMAAVEERVRATVPDAAIGDVVERAASGNAVNPAGVDAEVREMLLKVARTEAELVQRAGGQPGPVAATGGGARSRGLLQRCSDAIGNPVIVPESTESACLGAAVLAAVAAGYYPNLEGAVKNMVRVQAVLNPRSG